MASPRAPLLMMGAAATGAMTAAASLDREHRKRVVRMEREVLTHGGRLGPVHGDPHLVQPRERSRADAADDDRIDLLVVQGLQGVAGAVDVVLIAVVDRRD